MAISAYIGLPGGGKSYGVVENVIIPAVKSGRKVLTNVSLNIDELEEYVIKNDFPKLQINILDVGLFNENPALFGEIPGGTIIIIDEAWDLFPAGERANKIPVPVKDFFAKHRHKVGDDGYSQDIVLVTQDLSQLSSFVRQLIAETYVVRKLTAVGKSNSYRVDVFSGSYTLAKANPKNRLREIYGTYKPKVFKFYKSHTGSADGVVGNENKIDDRANLLKSGFIKFGLPLAILFLIFGVYFAYSTFSDMGKKDDDKIVTKIKNEISPYATVKSKKVKLFKKAGYFQLKKFSKDYSLIGKLGDTFIVASLNDNRNIYVSKRFCIDKNTFSSWYCRVGDELVANIPIIENKKLANNNLKEFNSNPFQKPLKVKN